MKQIIDIAGWKRREHYNFFKDYQEPFWGITSNVDCTKAHRYAKENNLSFFIYYMYRSIQAVNEIEEFRYRIEGDQVVCYNKIHACTTSLNANNLFGFAFFTYTDNFEEFYMQAKQEMDHLKTLTTMNLNEDNARPDVIHYSTIPWISFTALANERNLAKPDSIPKLTFGKYFKESNKLLLPLSISAHHGLMDGFHVGRYFELFQDLLNKD